MSSLSEEDMIFMINTSEHVNRPQDMLMFLGEYFKTHLYKMKQASDNILKTDQTVKGPKELSSYYITHDILNSLSTARKQFIENPRQELRISIALSRKPVFYTAEGDATPQLEKIRENI